MRVALVTLLLRLLALFPLGAVHALGGVIGLALATAPSRARHVAMRNLALCFPMDSEQTRRRLLRRALISTGKTIAETGAMWHWDCDKLLPLVSRVAGEEAVSAAFARGKGAIFLTPHLGSWEIAGLYAASRYPMTILYRKPRLAGLDPVIRTARTRSGARLATTGTAGVRTLLRTLNQGGVVGILPDQEPPPGAGMFVPFFGVPAYTMTLVPRLALLSGAPVFIAYCQRLDGKKGYYLHFDEIPGELLGGSTENALTAINGAIEKCVRRLPDQYQWTYKRFRRRPEGEPAVYS